MTTQTPFKTVLVDYDEDLFEPPAWVGDMLAAADIVYEAGQHRTPETALAAARDADVVLVQSVRPLLNRAVIQGLERCRCIVRLGIGYDSVDLAAASRRDILVCNVPDYCLDDVAEHALALLLACVRRVPVQDRWIREGRWDRTGARPVRRMRGCTLGFIAFGRIARGLAQRVQGFGLTLLAYDPWVDAETMAGFGVEKVELDDLLRRADFVSVHAPLGEGTRHLLSEREFGLMREGVYIVNTSRGPVIDEAALVAALRSGKVWGAGLDVMETEPLPASSPLREFANVVLTPHVGANSLESVDELYRSACQIAIDVHRGRRPASVVNSQIKGSTTQP